MVSTSIFLYSLNEFIKSKKIPNLIISFIIVVFAYLNLSLTFFLGLFLSSLVLVISNYFILNKTQLIAFILVMLISILSIYLDGRSFAKINAVKTNIDLNSDKPVHNLSVEVYSTSYKIMMHSIKEKPLGYGFNNYEQAFFEHIDKVDINFNKTKVLNSKDASNNFSKVVTETGVFSILFIYFFIIFLFSKKIKLEYKILIIPNFLTQTFLRGGGYFNGGYIIYLLLIYFLLHDKNPQKNKINLF